MTNTLTRPEWDLNYKVPKPNNKLVALWIAGIAIVGAIILTLVLVLSSHGVAIQTDSQSYQDGYSQGSPGTGVASGFGQPSCAVQWNEGVDGNGPPGFGNDNRPNWMAGCTAASEGLSNGTIPNGY